MSTVKCCAAYSTHQVAVDVVLCSPVADFAKANVDLWQILKWRISQASIGVEAKELAVYADGLCPWLIWYVQPVVKVVNARIVRAADTVALVV